MTALKEQKKIKNCKPLQKESIQDGIWQINMSKRITRRAQKRME